MSGRRRSPDFECHQGDFEGDFEGAKHHAEITGHTLTKETLSGTTITVSLEPNTYRDDDPYGGGGDE